MSASPWPCPTALESWPRIARSAGSSRPWEPAASSARRSVLGGEREREARLVGALDHHRALHLRVRRAERSAVDDVQERGRVDAEALGQRDRLAEALDQRQQPGVEHELHARRGAGLVAERDGAGADRVEHGGAALARLGRPGGDHGQLALLGRRLGAEHRRVDDRHARLRGAGHQPLGGLDAHRAHLRPDAPAGERQVARHGLDRRAVGEHRHHDVGALDGRGGRVRRPRPRRRPAAPPARGGGSTRGRPGPSRRGCGPSARPWSRYPARRRASASSSGARRRCRRAGRGRHGSGCR